MTEPAILTITVLIITAVFFIIILKETKVKEENKELAAFDAYIDEDADIAMSHNGDIVIDRNVYIRQVVIPYGKKVRVTITEVGEDDE